ncbi:hypothetical protein [Streptomyces sp. NPDC052042]|uniref:hypothetical protein n=1 Tax=Streptomyces sp. NPDC052042 TaxID=3365683 RepID=UPI0037D8DEDA
MGQGPYRDKPAGPAAASTARGRKPTELLNYVAATWDKQDLSLRRHARVVARALRTR